MSLGRLFDEVTIPYGDQHAKAMKIVCSGCGKPGYFPHERGPSRKPPVAAQQHFQNKGWQVGSVPKKDVCPDCLRKRKRKDSLMATTKPTSGPSAEPPREMTRDDRRIILDKLDQVYADPATGYRAPWTDAAVAKDLGIPVAWVAEVRDQFLGPAGSNPLFDDYLARREVMKAEFADLSASQKALADRFVSFCSKVDEMDRIGKRIEREIGR